MVLLRMLLRPRCWSRDGVLHEELGVLGMLGVLGSGIAKAVGKIIGVGTGADCLHGRGAGGAVLDGLWVAEFDAMGCCVAAGG